MKSNSQDPMQDNFSTGKRMRRSLSVSLARVTQKYREEQGSASAREPGARTDTVADSLQEMLLVLQVDVRMNIPGLISACNPPEIQELAEALLTVYSHEQGVHLERLWQWALKKHVQECSAQQPETLFRGTGLDTKVLSMYVNRECREFVAAVVAPFVRYLEQQMGLGVSLEVDPSKLPSSSSAADAKQLSSNRKALLAAVSKLLELLEANALCIPPKVSEMLRAVRGTVEKKFPEMADRTAGALLILRLLNPALCSPEQVMELPATASGPLLRRSLILVSKIVQNLANAVLFGEKEDYLVFANTWLTQSARRFSAFIFDVVFSIRPKDQQQQQQQASTSPTVEQLTNAVRWLHNFFCARRKVLLDKFVPQFFKQTAEGKQNAANFCAQIRRATNNFKMLPQPDAPREWLEPNEGRNILLRSYDRMKEGVESLSKRSSTATTMPILSHPPQPPQPQLGPVPEEKEPEIVIGNPVLVHSESVTYNPAFSPGRKTPNFSARTSSQQQQQSQPESLPRLRRGKSSASGNVATISSRVVSSRKTAVAAFELNLNAQSSTARSPARRTREDVLDELSDNGYVAPMELATPVVDENRSPMKRLKASIGGGRVSLGSEIEEHEFQTPTKRK